MWSWSLLFFACLPAPILSVEHVAYAPDCPGGATAVHSGYDRDRDGVLGAQEVDSTVHLCDPEVDGGRDGEDGDRGEDGEDGTDGTDGEDGSDGEDGLNSLLDIQPAGPSLCAAGGLLLRAGLDRDRDGRLSDAEVSSMGVVCNGEAAPPPPVRVQVEPVLPGPDCFWGGVRVVSGLDRDGDGALTGGEALSEALVCQGSGAIPALPAVSLVGIDAGPECPLGGVAVRSGLDLDGDGHLDPEEVSDSAPVCSGLQPPSGEVLEGSVTLTNSADVDAVRRYAVITGDLIISGTGLSRVELPGLREVGGAVAVGGSALRRLSLPALASAGRLSIAAPLLDEVDVSGLNALAGELRVAQSGALCLRAPALTALEGPLLLTSPTLTCLEAPELLGIGGAMTVEGAALAELDLPLVEQIGGPAKVVNTALVELRLPRVIEADGLDVRGASLEALDAPDLERLNGPFTVITPALTWFDTLALQEVDGAVNLIFAALPSWPDLGELELVNGDFTLDCGGACEASTPLGLGALREVNRLKLLNSAVAELPSLPRLERAVEVTVQNHPEARAWGGVTGTVLGGTHRYLIDLPALHVHLMLPGGIGFSDVTLRNTGVTGLTASTGSSGRFTLTDNPSLVELSLSSDSALTLHATRTPIGALHLGPHTSRLNFELEDTSLQEIIAPEAEITLTLLRDPSLERIEVGVARSISVKGAPNLTALEIRAFSSVARIALREVALEQIVWPGLTRGSLGVYDAPRLERVELPNLEATWPSTSEGNPFTSLSGLGLSEVPALTRVVAPTVANVQITAPAVTFARLLTSPGYTRYNGISGLISYNLSHDAIVEIGSVADYIFEDGLDRPAVLPPDGHLYRFPALTTASNVFLTGDAQLAPDPFPVLTELTALTVDASTQLTDFDVFPALKRVKYLIVTDNPALGACALERLLARLDAPPNTLTVSGNANPQRCP